MKKIAIYGGSFDPIHGGHITTAELACEHVDEVWLFPCWGHTFGKQMTEAQHRLELCNIVSKYHNRIKVLDFDIRHQQSDGTYESLKTIAPILKTAGIDFYILIGEDNAEVIHKWKNYWALINEYNFIVMPRQGCKPAKFPLRSCVDNQPWYLHGSHILAKGTTPSISSTDIRNAIYNRNSTELERLLDFETFPEMREVYEYINTHNLYRVAA